MKLLKEHIKSEKGAVMVEASIYFPIVLGIVFSLIYVSLWKIEECAVYFCAQKVANSAANAIAHQNFDKLYGNGDVVGIDTSIDFRWSSDIVPESNVKNYYKGRKDLYKRVTIQNDKYQKALKKMINATKFVGFHLRDKDINVKVDAGLLRTVVNVEVAIGFETPGIMKYVGFDDEIKFKSKGYQFASEPVDFVRNADLAVDLIEYLFDRLGISDNIKAFTDKWQQIKTKLHLGES